MEFEDIVKRVEWLDEQQRKARAELGEVAGEVAGVRSGLDSLAKEFKKTNRQLNDLSLAAARLEQFDDILAKHRFDLAKTIETTEKSAIRREQESARLHRADVEEIRKAVGQLQSAAAADETVRKDRAHEERRRALAIQGLETRLEAMSRQHNEILDAHKSLEEARRQDAKRFADVQAELASVGKRASETHEKTTLNGDSIRNLEDRIREIVESEAGRQERYAALLQQQALQQVERDRAWKEWQAKYESIKKQASDAESQVSEFEESIRAAREAEDAYDGLNQRLERRIAEVGEVQRLSEERIRQEWIAFKADEQKRWSGHTLSQDESIRNLRKDVDKMDERLKTLDDAARTIHDQFQQTTETTEKQLQELMNVSQDWLSAYERIMGHAKSKTTKPGR
jgi:chromosome segregation ATPase